MRVDVPRSAFAASILAAVALAGCGSAGGSGDPAKAPVEAARPRRRRPRRPKPRATAQGVILTRDPEEGDSFPLPAGTRGAQKAPLPDDAPDAPRRKASKGPGSEISPGAPSDAQIRRELKQMEQAIKNFNRGARGRGSAAVRAAVSAAATPRPRSARRT